MKEIANEKKNIVSVALEIVEKFEKRTEVDDVTEQIIISIFIPFHFFCSFAVCIQFNFCLQLAFIVKGLGKECKKKKKSKKENRRTREKKSNQKWIFDSIRMHRMVGNERNWKIQRWW